MRQHAATAGALGAAVRAGEDGPKCAVLALALHHYYTALETALSRVIRAIDGALPTGPDWHVALLEEAAQPLDPLRPALISPERLPALAELRRFRHFLRNAYPVNLDPSRLGRLAATLDRAHSALDDEMTALIEFLTAIGDELAE
jgi:hypothetical protein